MALNDPLNLKIWDGTAISTGGNDMRFISRENGVATYRLDLSYTDFFDTFTLKVSSKEGSNGSRRVTFGMKHVRTYTNTDILPLEATSTWSMAANPSYIQGTNPFVTGFPVAIGMWLTDNDDAFLKRVFAGET